MLPPSAPKVTYNRKKFGYFGEMGTSAHAHLRFMQTALTADELDSVTLIENIPGSERWDVRDLFQRDVDKERVTREILPYLKDTSTVKFFNPLTLALLPLDPSGEHIERQLPFVEPVPFKDGDHEYTVFEWADHYKFGRHDHMPAFSSLEWNDARVRVVAIDGQHRLSALKRWRLEGPPSSAELSNWTIPVVMLGVFRSAGGDATTHFLDVVRKTFVYINSTAREINEARETLLTDESVNAVCTQELIQNSHSNDCLPLEQRVSHRLPLIVFDWRGETVNGVRVPTPAALKTVEEVRDWFGWYILGDDGSDAQSVSLDLDDLIPPLTSFGPKKKLTHVDAGKIRQQAQSTILPGLQYCLENFEPYKEYVQACRKMEIEALGESDLAHHAFDRLRFGTSRESSDLVKDVQGRYEKLVQKFDMLKGKFLDELIARDIGMRAVMFAFGAGKEYFDEPRNEASTWLDYSKWYTDALNAVYSDGWFRSHAKLDTAKRKAMTHVVFDASGSIVNYKIEHVPGAFGALATILLFRAGRKGVVNGTFETVLDEFSERLRSPLSSGYRRQVKAEIQDEFKGTPAAFKEEVKKKANHLVEKHLNEIKKLALA